MRIIDSIQEIEPLYSTYIVDVWGVLYDGYGFSHHALDTLRFLKTCNHRVILLSNSTRTSHDLHAQFSPQGLSSDLYDRFVTSGDYVQTILQELKDRWGSHVYFIGTPAHRGMLDPFALITVDDPEDAHFGIFASLPEDWDTLDIQPFEEPLKRLHQKNIPVLCANPDLYSMQGSHKKLCAGTLAASYETLGGHVTYSGKPQPEIYRYALNHRSHLDPTRVLCIGDALRTDIQGAKTMGFDSLWILGGVHQDIARLNTLKDQQEILTALCHREGCMPTYSQWSLR